MLKVVIDTNLLIDGAADFYNFANRIIDLIIGGQIEAYANTETLRENRFLARKKIVDEGYLRKLEYFFEAVRPVASKPEFRVVEDEEDNKILSSAVAADADYLITSDHHLLKLEKYKRVRIVRPNEFWSRYEDEGTGWTNWLRRFIN